MRMLSLLAFLSALIVGAEASNALNEKPRVVLISGSELYQSDVALGEFKDYLEKQHNMSVTLIKAVGKNDLPGLEALEDCDAALIYTRRLEIEGEQLERIQNYCRSGKPLIAVRTTSHGFQKWLELDSEVLGGSYHGHYKAGVPTRVIIAPGMEDHPILSGVGILDSTSSLYRTHPIAKDAQFLLGGVAPESAQPLAWMRGRTFYTSLGSVEDFRNPNFRRLLANAILWAIGN